MANIFSRTLGQQFVIENAAGAGGTTGALRASRATPDGYTLFVHNVAPHVSGPVLYPSATYDPIKNFIPIGTLAFAAHYVVVRKDFPAKDLKSLIDFAKANPGKINFGSAGAGSATHLACVLFGQQTGTQITHVPYRGTGPALNDLVAGTLDLMCDQGLNMMGQATAGGVNVLAIAQKTRFPGLPNVPTTAEAGLPGFEVQAATAMYAIAGTPEPVREEARRHHGGRLQGRERAQAHRGARLRASRPRPGYAGGSRGAHQGGIRPLGSGHPAGQDHGSVSAAAAGASSPLQPQARSRASMCSGAGAVTRTGSLFFWMGTITSRACRCSGVSPPGAAVP